LIPGIADDAEGIERVARQQVQVALEEADLVFFIVDAREGLSASIK
jgi:GTP-binding protein